MDKEVMKKPLAQSQAVIKAKSMKEDKTLALKTEKKINQRRIIHVTNWKIAFSTGKLPKQCIDSMVLWPSSYLPIFHTIWLKNFERRIRAKHFWRWGRTDNNLHLNRCNAKWRRDTHTPSCRTRERQFNYSWWSWRQTQKLVKQK